MQVGKNFLITFQGRFRLGSGTKEDPKFEHSQWPIQRHAKLKWNLRGTIFAGGFRDQGNIFHLVRETKYQSQDAQHNTLPFILMPSTS